MIVGLFLAQRLQRIDLRAGMYHASIASPASRTEYWLLKQRKVNELLRNRAASDSITRAARGIGLIVVGLGMNHQSSAAVGNKRVAPRA